MFKHYFERIAGQVSVYPLFSLAVFFIFFLSLLVWVAVISKKHVDYMQALPLHDGSEVHNSSNLR